MKNIIAVLTFFALFSADVLSCTSFIISGRITPDGRPLLYKNRDSDCLQNALHVFNDGKYRYVAVVNSDSTWKTMVWGGYNEAGFAIMNTAAFTNNIGDTVSVADREGIIMKQALMFCGSVADFEMMLDTLQRPLGVDANFGVIDAFGAAAFYETGNDGYVKFDVNDPKVAPDGILVRTNFSETGEKSAGFGFCRYNTARQALDVVRDNKDFSPKKILHDITRSLQHSLTQTNLWDNIPTEADKPDYRFFTDYISRYGTSSSILIKGTKHGEDAKNTVMWTVMGFPLTTVAVPVWLNHNGDLPKILSMNENLQSPLCAANLKLAEVCFPFHNGNGYRYINLSLIVNQQNTGFLQQVEMIENEIFNKAKVVKINPTEENVSDFYRWIDGFVADEYKRKMNVVL